MGYTTSFDGQVKIVPPLNKEEIEYLQKFNHTRRMNRSNGPYYVDGSGDFGQGKDPDVISYNDPPAGQPGLWCQWRPTDDGQYLEWDGGEKFYNSPEWMKYIIDHFMEPSPTAKDTLPFLQTHILNGEIEAQGEDNDDRWRLIVENNVVSVSHAHITVEYPVAVKV